LKRTENPESRATERILDFLGSLGFDPDWLL